MNRFMGRGARRVALPLAFVLAASAALVNPATIVAGTARSDDDWWVGLAMQMIAPVSQGIDRYAGVPALSTGTDGRLTFLLLGSDSRGTAVSRTDTILVASIKGKQISMASIPRDTGHIPNPFSGGYFKGKVNGIARSFMLGGVARDEALRRLEIVIENLLRIEIDYRAVIWFGGLTTLVGKIDPITVTIPREIRDPKQVDDPGMEWGVYFPQANSYSLYDYNPAGRQRCNGNYKRDTRPPVASTYWCRRALPFVRSRKGPGNNDWVRAKRQQGFIHAAIQAVGAGELNALYATALGQGGGKWITNMPLTIANVNDLYSRLKGATLSHRVVFKPNVYATRMPGTSSWELKLSAVRAWTAAYMR